MSSRKKPRSSTVPVSANDDATAMSRTFREVAPAHYLFQIKSFSLLSSTEEERFESGNFSSGGYQWKLCLYPNGDKKEDGEGHVSLYLAISETDTLPPGWEVNVNFKLFVYDKVRDNYLTIQDADARVSRFHKLKTACGFPKLISLDTFNEVSNGYLVDDSCAFGAEVFVIKCTGEGECLSVIKELLDNTYTWEIKNFPEVEDTILHSNAFFVGNHEWKLLVYPKGTGNGEGNSMSLFLELADCGTIPSKPALYVEFFLRVKDGLHGEYYQRKAHSWFYTETESWGFHKMVSLAELHDKSKGFIVEGTLEVEVQIDVMAVVKDFSKS